MKHYFCSCCDKEFERLTTFHAVRDGKRLLYLHGECFFILSGGENRAEECGVVIENDARVTSFGDVCWYIPGTLIRHREGGPAYEGADGTKQWYLNGMIHREDGPAVEETNGNKCWYRNGKLHREDGPAWESVEGVKYWYFKGAKYTEEEWKAEVK